MFQWLARTIASTTTTVTFFTIFLVGVVFSAFSLVFGGHGDNADHDAGSSDIGHDADHAGDGHGSGHHDGDSGGFFSVGMFSVRGIALLSTGFGGFGFLIFAATQKVIFSTAGGLVGGYIFAFLVLYTLKIFKSQQANSLVAMSAAVGLEGIVTVSIPENGLGEVNLLVSGSEMFKPARSDNGMPIRSGTSVRVKSVTGGTCVVAPSAAASTATGSS